MRGEFCATLVMAGPSAQRRPPTEVGSKMYGDAIMRCAMGVYGPAGGCHAKVRVGKSSGPAAGY